MSSRHRDRILSGLCALLFAWAAHAQQAPSPAGARILLLPRRIVSGERATLAVLDMNGRLTPGVTVAFSNGDRLTTDQSGRALLVAPLNPGVIYGTIEGRRGRVPTTIAAPTEAELSLVEINSVPRIASLSDPPARRIGAFTETDDPGQRKRKPKLWLKSFAASKAVQGFTRCQPAIGNEPPQSVPAG